MGRGHSKLSPSKADRWSACPGSIRACEGIPDLSGAAAEEGTRAHSLLEYCLRGNVEPMTTVGMVFQNDPPITEDMAQAVAVAWRYVREKALEYPEHEVAYEGLADLKELHPGLWGSFDVMISAYLGHCLVIDYKHGRNPVDITTLQLAVYALAPYLHLDASAVTVVVIQPRAPHEDGPIREHTYDREALRKLADRISTAAAATDDPNAPRAAGAHCKYCAASATCPELAQRSLAVAQLDFTDLSGPQNPPRPQDLSAAQLRDVLGLADMIGAWLKAVRAYAYAKAYAGEPPEGMKLVLGNKGKRKWLDEAAAADELEFLGVNPWDKSMRSPADVEAELGKAATKAVGHLVHQADARPKLVSASDPKPAWTPPPSFQPIPFDDEGEA